MNKEAADLGLTLDLETHRDTCTKTPEKTWKIAELYTQKTEEMLRLNFDFSDFRGREASLPAVCRPPA